MSIIGDSIATIGSWITQVISLLGYGGILVLMVLESMIAPVPSELVMPFAGFLASQGRFSLWLVILVSGIGSIIGSGLGYAMGRYGGNPLVLRYGRFLLLDEADLRWTEQWFAKHGDKTVFISRFIPVVRHVISIPAGIAKMNLVKFFLYTTVGATLWNAILAGLGFYLGEQWALVRHYSEPFSITVAALLGIAFLILAYRHIKHKHGLKHTGQ